MLARPLLFLDVDGVLNVPVRSKEEMDRREVKLKIHRFYPNDLTMHFMWWVWEWFDVRWLTAWYDDANLIADWAGLPHRPALRERYRGHVNDWKVSIVRRFREVLGRPIAWVEDGFSDEARAWREARRDTVLIATEPFVGVTWGTIHALEGLCLGRR